MSVSVLLRSNHFMVRMSKTTTILLVILFCQGALPQKRVYGADKLRSILVGRQAPSSSASFYCKKGGKALRQATEDTEMRYETLSRERRELQEKRWPLRQKVLRSTRNLQHRMAYQREEGGLRRALQKSKIALRRTIRRLRQLRACLLRDDLRLLLRQNKNHYSNRLFLSQLQEWSRRLGRGPRRLASTHQRRLRRLFYQIYRHFWSKKSLQQRDCRLLQQTYGLWSSLYPWSNEQNRKIGKGEAKIPLYNSNGHHVAYTYWALESHKKRMPAGGLTLVHVDSHPDMGSLEDSADGHWSNKILSLRQINEALRQRSDTAFWAYLRQKIAAASGAGLSSVSRRALLSLLRRRTFQQLRQELREQLRRRVSGIAQPVTAAAYTHLASKLVLVLPPWSERLALSPLNRHAGQSEGLFVTLIEENKSKEISFGVPHKFSNAPLMRLSNLPPVLLFHPSKNKYKALGHRVPLHVARSSSEEQQFYPDHKCFVTRENRKKKLPPLSRYFRPHVEGQQGFILDIDLDAFASNGEPWDAYLIPLSYERSPFQKKAPKLRACMIPKKHEDPLHDFVSAREFALVKGRLQQLFHRLQEAARHRYSPRMITLADSTYLQPAFFARGEWSENSRGGNYTPACLVFLINYQLKRMLTRLYRLSLPLVEPRHHP